MSYNILYKKLSNLNYNSFMMRFNSARLRSQFTEYQFHLSKSDLDRTYYRAKTNFSRSEYQIKPNKVLYNQ